MNTRAIVATSALGLAAGMRSMTPLAALGLSGSRAGLGTRALLALGAESEFIFDKLPRAGARTELPAFAGRILAGTLAGNTVARRAGASRLALMATGALSAWVATRVFHRARVLLSRRAPGFAVGVGEDLLALAVAAAAVRLLPPMGLAVR